MRSVLGILIAAVLSSVAVGARAQSNPPAFFAFVLLGEGSDGRPVPMARGRRGATTCPVLQRASGARQAMRPRERPPGGGFECVNSGDAVNQLYRAASSVAAAEQSLP
jgi:hypothetical protein